MVNAISQSCMTAVISTCSNDFFHKSDLNTLWTDNAQWSQVCKTDIIRDWNSIGYFDPLTCRKTNETTAPCYIPPLQFDQQQLCKGSTLFYWEMRSYQIVAILWDLAWLVFLLKFCLCTKEHTKRKSSKIAIVLLGFFA